MNDTEVAGIDPGRLWLPPNRCSRSPVWAYIRYRTPEGVEGRLVFDSGDDALWRYITADGTSYLPWFSRHMCTLLPGGTVCVLHDKFRRWNTADFVVGVDERLRWRY